jgi:hypothetical protein
MLGRGGVPVLIFIVLVVFTALADFLIVRNFRLYVGNRTC